MKYFRSYLGAVARCDPVDTVPLPPVRAFEQCLRADQVAGAVADRRWANTKWILNSDGPVAPDQFLTTHRHSFAVPGACPRPGARRAWLLRHYLLHRHALGVGSARQGRNSPGWPMALL